MIKFDLLFYTCLEYSGIKSKSMLPTLIIFIPFKQNHVHLSGLHFCAAVNYTTSLKLNSPSALATLKYCKVCCIVVQTSSSSFAVHNKKAPSNGEDCT